MLSWGVSSYQADRRERRKETRSEVDACCKLASELLDKARKFYEVPGNAASARALAADIKFQFTRLLKRTERLEKQNRAFRLRGPVGKLMDSMTGSDFESVARPPYLPDSERLVVIETDVHSTMDELEAAFGRIYGSGWFVRLKNWRPSR